MNTDTRHRIIDQLFSSFCTSDIMEEIRKRQNITIEKLRDVLIKCPDDNFYSILQSVTTLSQLKYMKK